MEDKREFVRFNSSGTVILHIEGVKGEGLKTELVDICFGGLGCTLNISTPEKINEGAKLSFDLVTPVWKEAISGTGVVKYVKSMKRGQAEYFRIGIVFTEIDKNSIRIILNQIQREMFEQTKKKPGK